MNGQNAADQQAMRFIVHADDCGLTPSISADIFACLAKGPLNSVSVVMGGSDTEASLQALAHMPRTRVCLHLNILEGRCSAPIGQVRPLVDEAGVFRYGLGQMLAALAAGTAARNKALLFAIRTELEAQIDAFAASFGYLHYQNGLHLDGHLHIHCIPALQQTMAELIREHRPSYVRLPNEPAHLAPLPILPLLVGCARRALLARWSAGFVRLLDSMGIAHNQYLCGLVAGGNLTAARVAASLAVMQHRRQPSPLVEIMCHPGGISAHDADSRIRHKGFYQSPARQTEKGMLLDGSLGQVLARYGTVWNFAADTPPPCQNC